MLRIRLSATLLSAPFLALAALHAVGAHAADALPVAGLDARAVGDVSSAATTVPGAIFSGASIGASSGAIQNEKVIGRDAASGRTAALLRDAHRADVFVGGALTSRLELSLGLHGTYETMTQADRAAVYEDAEKSAQTSAFSGASLFAKFKFLDAQGFKLALAPFVETGAGDGATYALTRSVGPKAGFMAIGTYGARGVGAVDLDVGMRYRDPEQLGGVLLRNELFYKILVTADVSSKAAIFAGAEGRKLSVATVGNKDDAGISAYTASEAAQGKLGVKLAFGDADLSLFYGARLKDAKGFGYGDRMAGLAVAMELGNARGARPKNSMATAIESEEAEKAGKSSEPTAVAADDKSTYDEYPEMIGAEIDPLEALKGQPSKGDDFADVEKILEENRKSAGELSEDAKIEKELAEIRAAKAKAEAEQAKLDAKELENTNKQRRARAKEEEKMMKQYSKEAREDLDKNYQGIGDDEVKWNGLGE